MLTKYKNHIKINTMRDRNTILKCLLMLFLVIIPNFYNSITVFLNTEQKYSLTLNIYSALSWFIKSFQYSFPVLVLLYFNNDSYKEYGFKKITIKEFFVSLLNFMAYMILLSAMLNVIILIYKTLNKNYSNEIWNTVTKTENSIIMILVNFIPMMLMAFSEELCFRSYLYKNLNKLIENKLICIIIINILFSIYHIYQGINGVIKSFIFGMALSWEFKRNQNIFTISIFHLTNNIIAFI